MYTPTLQRYHAMLEAAMPGYLPSPADPADAVALGMRAACADGGKRLRPVLLLAFAELCGGEAAHVLPFAAAVEMIHSYSLVHDDMPCMDNSPLRRGKPAVHAAFGEDMALLVGDALLTRAFEVMLCPEAAAGISADRVLAAAGTLAKAAGIGGMIGGQRLDLQSEGKAIDLATLERLQQGKTAALIAAPCQMGAILAGASPEQTEAAYRFGYALGCSFQMIDDILDVTGDAATLGKPVGGDETNRKSTYVSLLGLDKARALAAERAGEAARALTVFGDDAKEQTLRRELAGLADTLLKREW